MMNLEELVNDIEKRCDEANPKVKGDYVEDGILICGNCETPKQCKITIGAKEHIVPCLCECKIEHYKREENKRKQEKTNKYISYLKEKAFASPNMEKWRFEFSEDTKIINEAKKYAAGFENYFTKGEGLVFYGDVGTGKSYAAACVVNALTDKGYRCMFTTIPNLANDCSDYGKLKIDWLLEIDLLVLDDYSAHKNNTATLELLYEVINARLNANLPIIVTTNMSREDFAKDENRRINSRLYQACRFFEAKGEDRRKRIYRDRANNIYAAVPNKPSYDKTKMSRSVIGGDFNDGTN